MRRWSKMQIVAILLVVAACVCLRAESIDGFDITPLDEFISYYEPVVFQTQSEFPTLVAQNTDLGSKTKKGALTTERVEIRAFGRTFNLLLSRTSKILAPNAAISVLATTSGCVPQRIRTEDFLAHLVEGEVCDEEQSFVHGTWRAGVFSGAIHIKNNTYFVERATKYFHEKVPFDAVMFRMQDLNLTAFDCMGTDGETEGHCDPIQLLQKVGPKSLEVKPVDEEPLVEASSTPPPNLLWFSRGKKNTCHLKLVADHLFYQNAGDGFLYNAVYEMIFHVSEANQIFRATDFDEDGSPDQVGFQIEALDIVASPECAPYPPSGKSAVTSDQYLEQFSEHDLQNYCVGVAFSGYTFPGRVLGIAWMADSESGGYVGGICEPRLFSTHDQKALSFNSAVITIMLEGRRVPRGITAIAVAHELGHSFGSDHDPYQDPICSPSKEEGGKYIMAAYAVKGDRPNNRYFSPCSKRSMSTVLTKKSSCFGVSSSVSADDEDVDAADTLDHSAYSAKSQQDPKADPDDVDDCDCYQCAYGELEDHMSHECCCSPTCKVIHSETKKPVIPTLDDPDDCVFPPGNCDADPTVCSEPEYRPDGTPCNDGRGICRQGTCFLEAGTTAAETGSPDDNECIVCCRDGDPEFSDEESIGATCIPLKRSEHPWIFNKKHGGVQVETKCECSSRQCKNDHRGKCGHPVLKPEGRNGEQPSHQPSLEDEAAQKALENEEQGSTGVAVEQPRQEVPEAEADPPMDDSVGENLTLGADADNADLNAGLSLQEPVGEQRDELDGKAKSDEVLPGAMCDMDHLENCVMWIAPAILMILLVVALLYIVLPSLRPSSEKRVAHVPPRCKLPPAPPASLAPHASLAPPVFYRPSRNMASLDLACRGQEQHGGATSNLTDQARSKSL